ncbi:MAG: YoaK family protein [Negativicutes bacterium]|nr:YoaK family protein [Negativicutes bacterium]
MQRSTTLLLPAIAGFVDTSTFIHVSGLFAAHFTGNFILFAAALARGVTPNDYLKLLSFFFFTYAVWAGTWVYKMTQRRGFRIYGVVSLLLLEAILLLAVSLIAAMFPESRFDAPLAMTLVVAMGLQNALHYFTPGPMSTAMTGNAMRWIAVLAERFMPFQEPAGVQTGELSPAAAKPQQPIGSVILSFAVGCVVSAFLTMHFGLSANLLPGVIVMMIALVEKQQQYIA